MIKTKIKDLLALLLPIIICTVSLFIFSVYLKNNPVYGYGYNYGYNYNEDDEDEDEDNKGENYEKYSYYKKRYDNDLFKAHYDEVKYIRDCGVPSISQRYWKMKEIYYAYKGLPTDELERLYSPQVKEMFYKYKHFYGHRLYRHYKDKVD